MCSVIVSVFYFIGVFYIVYFFVVIDCVFPSGMHGYHLL